MIETAEKDTGRKVYALCSVGVDENRTIIVVPIAEISTNLLDRLVDPSQPQTPHPSG